MKWACVVLLSWLGAQAHRLQGAFTVSPTDKDARVYYITKFACAIGECKYNVRAGIKHADYTLQRASARAGTPLTYHDINNLHKTNGTHDARLIIRVVLDDEWDMSHHLAPCKRAELGRGRTTLTVPLDGSMGPWSTNSFRQSHRPHFWYFFAEDCRNHITAQMKRLLQLPETHTFDEHYDIMYEIEILQTDGGHLSYELRNMLLWNLMQVLAYAALAAWMYQKERKIMKTQRLHIMVQILNASCLLHLVGSVLNTVYLYQMNRTGHTYNLLSGLSDSLLEVSNISITSCLILIALGVTLNAPQNMIPMPLVKLAGGCIALLHLVVVLVDKYAADHRYKYYNIEGNVGYVLILFRVLLFVAFVSAFKHTTSDPRTPTSTQKFLNKIFLPSSAYFATLPLFIVVTKLFKPYMRHSFLAHATNLSHVCATIVLAELFLSKGEYFKVSQMSQSFLPGGVWTVAAHHID